MDARELRIGNYVTVDHPRHGEKYIEVESVTNDTINMEFRPYYIGDLQPIPLTEDWLLKFGFVYIYGEWHKEGFNFCINDKIVYTSNEFNYTEVCKLESVHQLQNLYYSLTGEELCIT